MEKPKITPRQAKILAAIVKEYTAKPEPVGSETLEVNYDFSVSPATIRNEMKALERAGFIHQPHTSAGRVPTDAGYRYFISELMKHVELSMREQEHLRQEIRKLRDQHFELGKRITRLLADTSQSAAFALLPEAHSTAGFSNIVEENMGQENLKAVANFFDNLDVEGKALMGKGEQSVKAYIGKESPIPLSGDVSLLVSKVRLPGGKNGVVGIIGSKRMKYAKNMSLLKYISKLLGGGVGMIIMINLF